MNHTVPLVISVSRCMCMKMDLGFRNSLVPRPQVELQPYKAVLSLAHGVGRFSHQKQPFHFSRTFQQRSFLSCLFYSHLHRVTDTYVEKHHHPGLRKVHPALICRTSPCKVGSITALCGLFWGSGFKKCFVKYNPHHCECK